jgi:hypothetical protein
MNSPYIIDPSDTIAKMCSESGRFLEDDYYMAMSHNEVPESYWKKTNNAKNVKKRIVIVGSQESPMTITKNAFLALTLAKPDKLTIKINTHDEAILLKEMYQQNKKIHECDFSVYHTKKQELATSGAWLRDLENSTDIIVFGSLETLLLFDMETTQKHNFYLRKPKISFGIVTKECLDNEDNLAGLAGDFLSFFGEGKLAPKFYITLGKLSKDQMIYIADCMRNEEETIKEFRAKLSLSKKSLLIQENTYSNSIYPHVKKSTFDNPEFLAPLFGDVRLIEVQHEGQIEEFVEEYAMAVSTIALEEDTLGDMAAGWEFDIPRYCSIGSMQFPYFYEPVDEIDDIEIFNNDLDIV